jgi:excinuclease ABC subunit A
MGPEGGEQGGYIVAEGTPEAVAADANSHTGRFLKATLDQHAGLTKPRGKVATVISDKRAAPPPKAKAATRRR